MKTSSIVLLLFLLLIGLQFVSCNSDEHTKSEITEELKHLNESRDLYIPILNKRAELVEASIRAYEDYLKSTNGCDKSTIKQLIELKEENAEQITDVIIKAEDLSKSGIQEKLTGFCSIHYSFGLVGSWEIFIENIGYKKDNEEIMFFGNYTDSSGKTVCITDTVILEQKNTDNEVFLFGATQHSNVIIRNMKEKVNDGAILDGNGIVLKYYIEDLLKEPKKILDADSSYCFDYKLNLPENSSKQIEKLSLLYQKLIERWGKL
jgi:hypothetical protein